MTSKWLSCPFYPLIETFQILVLYSVLFSQFSKMLMYRSLTIWTLIIAILSMFCTSFVLRILETSNQWHLENNLAKHNKLKDLKNSSV